MIYSDDTISAKLVKKLLHIILEHGYSIDQVIEHIGLNFNPLDPYYQQIKDEFRKNIALNYINRPDLSINTIATLMGFLENSAFYRSFKKWTGLSPGKYRQQLEQGEVVMKDKTSD